MMSISLVLTVFVMMMGLHHSQARVDYRCVYGPLMSTRGECVCMYVCVCVCVCMCVCVYV